uniref:Uncharacterized protein n=1 Tax=Anguilla anguilla TaxID=7936 RepID=A0A0E9PMU2_ANGAN
MDTRSMVMLHVTKHTPTQAGYSHMTVTSIHSNGLNSPQISISIHHL